MARRLICNSKIALFGHNLILRNMSYSLIYKSFGDPPKVLEKVETKQKNDLGPTEVMVDILAAPINPADINMIQGTYGIKPPLPAVGGNECVGKITKVGVDVKSLKVGSWVIPASAGWGTWKMQASCDEKELIEVRNDLPLEGAATIAVNPCTAYRMLTDFEQLKKGDSVIQNGSNSGVGQAAIQIAKFMGVHSINVVRDRPDLADLKAQLTSLGADYVVTEEELRTKIMEDIFKAIPKPKLALNCVGGKSAVEIMRHLGYKGTMVTYGGMSKQPLTIPTGLLIFNDLSFRGYWMTNWNKNNFDNPERKKMIDYLCDLMVKGALKPPNCRLVPFDNFVDAVTKSMQPFTSEKQILVMN